MTGAEAEPFGASLRVYRGDPEQEFVFSFSSDGEVDMLDVTYGEIVTGGHFLAVEDLAWLAQLPETEVANDGGEEPTAAGDERSLPAGDERAERIRTETERVFAELNERLENPLILPWPSDEHLYVSHGTVDDLIGVLAGLAYLSRERGGPETLALVTREADIETSPDLSALDERLRPVVASICSRLDPYGTQWQDDDDEFYGRRTGHTRGGFFVDVEAEDARAYLAPAVTSGRVRAWLDGEFARLGIDRSRLDEVFPTS